MTNKLLLPHKYKALGWYILIPSTIIGIILLISEFQTFSLETKVFALMNEELLENTTYFSIISKNVVPTAIGVLFIIGALLVSFSKEKLEDEFIAEIRQSSLLWAVLVNYILLLLAFVFIYGLAFMNVMIYNMFTILIIFIIRFNYILYKSSKEMPNEKYNQSATSY
jgi:hypothetical protein